MKIQWKEGFKRSRFVLLQNAVMWTLITAAYIMLVPVKNIPKHLLTVTCIFSCILLCIYLVMVWTISYRVHKYGRP